MSGSHSILSPSKLAQIVRCPGSLAAAKNAPPEKPSEDAASGTATHQLAETALRSGEHVDYILGTSMLVDYFSFIIDSERLERVHAYADAILREPGERLIEVRLDTSAVLGVPGQSGTADAITLDRERGVLSVHDLKDGVGIVYAKDNEQLATYLAAALYRFDLECEWGILRACIHQPRMNHYDEVTYTREQLTDFMRGIALAAQGAYNLWLSGTPEQIRAAMVPGEKQCRWCRIRGACPARAAQVLDLFPVDDPEVTFAPPELADAEVAAALARTDEIERWCRDIRSEALRRALAGKTLPGFKVVQGKMGARRWIDKAKAESILSMLLTEEQMYEPREIRSPAQLDKLLKKDYDTVKPLVTQPPGSLSIAPESDERPAIAVSGLTEFEVIT